MLKLLSNHDPRFLTHGLGLIRLLPTVMEHQSNLSSCCRVPTNRNSVLSSLIINYVDYGLRTVMNTGKTSNYESLLKLLGMRTLEHRRIEQSLIIFFKCFKENGPRYITNLFKPRVTPYNLRSSGLNVEQRPYNSRFFHGSYSYIISRIWNQLPPAAKNAANVPAFINHLNTTNFGGCQCSSCLK